MQLQKENSFEQMIRNSPEDGAVHTEKCRRDLVINMCTQLYNVHLV